MHQAFEARASDTPGSKRGWWPFLANSVGLLPSKEGTLLLDAQERMLLVKGKHVRYGVPMWITGVRGSKGVYRLSTLKQKNGRTNEVIYDAFALEALLDPEVAKGFQASIELINKWATDVQRQ